MPEDVPLDEFTDAGDAGADDDEGDEADETAAERGSDADGTGGADGAGGVDDAGDDADGADVPRDPDAVEPARPTSDWSPDGAACGECGAVVERRWRDGDAYVCGDCKEW